MELGAKYIYQVYLSKSFSKASKSLYISQPSLSAAIASKEKELGFRVFDRSTKPISLTREGEIYIEMLEEMVQSENNMFHRLKQLQNDSCRAISVGSSAYVTYYLLPTVCGAFYRRYPNTEVRLDIGNNNQGDTLFQKLEKKMLDIVFTYDYDRQKYKGYPVFEERMVVAMHKSFLKPSLLPYAMSREEILAKTHPVEKEILDMTVFHDIPFLSFSKNGSTGRYMSDMLGFYSVSAHSVFNARHSGVHYNMMCAGLGAILTGDSAVRVSVYRSDDIVYFAFPKEISSRKMFAVFRKNDVAEPGVEQFMEILKEVSASDKSLSLYYV